MPALTQVNIPGQACDDGTYGTVIRVCLVYPRQKLCVCAPGGGGGGSNQRGPVLQGGGHPGGGGE